MLSINDLKTNKTLDHDEMGKVSGGRSERAASFLEQIMTDYSYREDVNIQSALTGQSNQLAQSVDVYSQVGGKGNLVMIKGGTNFAEQINGSHNING